MNARQLLDLAELFDSPTTLAAALRSPISRSLDEVLDLISPASDATSRRTAHLLLQSLAAIDSDGQILGPGASTVADGLDLALDLRSELTVRQPPPRSQLVVTATTSPELAALRRTLNLRPLFQLVEDVIRAAHRRCVLGAPYWNSAALDRLRPSLAGLARRGGAIEFICQAVDPDDQFNPVGTLRRCCTDLVAEGAEVAEVWAFDVRDDTSRRALIHAKFAVADARLGYLGSANMTGQGFAEHFEIGVRLALAEAAELVSLLDRLRSGGFLARQP